MSSLVLMKKSLLYVNAMQKTKKKKKTKLKKEASSKHHQKLDLKMCRLCNDERGHIPMFNNLEQPNIPEEIKNFSGVTVSLSDNLPQQMCQGCLDLLNGCIMFREMCQKTNQLLIDLSIKKETNDYGNGHHIKSDDEDDVRNHIKFVDDHNHIRTDDEDDDHRNSDDDLKSEVIPECLEKTERWSCDSCNIEFYSMESYNTHLKECKKEASEPKKRRRQINCKRRNQPPATLKKTFLCDTCGKTSRSKASLLVHMGTHENIFPFKCEQCEYQGRTMDLLKIHQRSHLVDKPFKCSQCPKATTTSSNLAKHMRHVHSNNRPFKCTYCEKAFSYMHDMKRHVKDIHLRTSVAECDVCFKKFNTRKILQGHRWKIHKIKGERQGRLPSYLQVTKGGRGARPGGQTDGGAEPVPPTNNHTETVY